MKRSRADGALVKAQPARRQPQTSCDSCRQKKIKCDRGLPCGNCRARGLVCSILSPAASPVQSVGESPDFGTLLTGMLGRLTALEQAVFRSSALVQHGGHHVQSPPKVLPVSGQEREGRQTASFLDNAYDGGSLRARDRAGYQRLYMRVAGSCQASVALAAPDNGLRPGPVVWLVPQPEAIAMVHDFVENAYHLMPIVHMASMRAVISNVYSVLQADNGAKVDPAQAALILGLCAACAFFWNENVPCHHRFETDQAAADALLVWRTSALESLEEAQRLELQSLEAAQACAILAYLTYNIYGPSTRFYCLHTWSITACRELGIHLMDSRACESTQEDAAGAGAAAAATREVKRRLWWHVTATDWMLGLNGGPLDGTYTIHPRQIKVSLPRNLNDSHLATDSESFSLPPHIATQASCFLQVIRLAEICRAVVDSQGPDDSVADTAHNERVLASDQLFREAMQNMPPPLALTAPIPADAPRFLCLQRASLHLGFHSRRARLHRPFLLHRDSDGLQGTKYPVSRDVCVRSARMVLDISTCLLEHSLPPQKPALEPPGRQQILHHPGHDSCPGSPVHRLGVVINHLFCACAILAFECNLRAGSDDVARAQPPGPDDLEGMLIYACRLLAAAQEECTVAADIVRAMRNVFARYCIRGASSHLLTPESQEPQAQPVGSESAALHLYNNSSIASEIHQQIGSAWPGAMDENQLPSEGDPENAAAWGDFDRTLDEIFISADMYGNWDQIFARLGSYCGP